MRRPPRPCCKCGKATRNRPSYCDSCKPLRVTPTREPTKDYDRHWRKLRRVALERDDYICQECHKPAGESAHVDHITPIAAGGERLDLDNLQTLCRSCHSVKTRRENAGR